MSNKKRISRKVKAIKTKKDFKLFILACEYASEIITRIIESKKQHYNSLSAYPIGGIMTSRIEKEKVVDSHGDEVIIPKFEIKRHPCFLNTHKAKQS